MIEFGNINPYKSEPDYFYRVFEIVTTFKADHGQHDPYSHTQDFKGRDLGKSKRQAEKYYNERLLGFENGSYFLPFESPENFELGKHAAHSLVLSLVEHYAADDEIEHILIGENEEAILESKQVEFEVLKSKGIIL